MKSLAFSVIAISSLWFLPSVLAIVNKNFGDCDYQQTILPGRDYSIFSPENPFFANYQPGTKCRWTAISDRPIQLSCSIFVLPKSDGCRDDFLEVETFSKPEQRFCGNRRVNIVSKVNTMVVSLITSRMSRGGRFLCTIKTISEVVPATNNCRCGWKNPTRIANGINTGVNEYPMMAEIIDSSSEILCGATIINDKQVITAAHCVFYKNHETIGVLVGEHDLSTRIETTGTKLFRVASFEIHESFDERTLDYDIALINIDGVIRFSELVGPVCLPFKHTSRDFEDKTVEILGWGSLGPVQSPSNTLQKTSVKVISQERCSYDYPGRIGSRQICTLDPKSDSCQYDSGGPVLWRNPKTRRTILVAIIGYGMICTDGRPSVNTKINAYIDWIVSKKPPGWRYCSVE